jgi:hypothetical protein
MKLRSGTVIIAPPIQRKIISKPVKKCSFCKKSGHNISVCTEKKEAVIISVLFKFINSCETKEQLHETLSRFILPKLKLLAKHFELKLSNHRKHIILDELIPLCIENQTTQWINNYEIIKDILEEHPGYSLIEIVDMKVIEIVRNINNRNANARYLFTNSNWFDRLKFSQQSPTIRRQIYEGYINAFTYLNSVHLDEENSSHHWKIEPMMSQIYTKSELRQVKQCPICYDETHEIQFMTTNCNHTFCNTCMTTHLETERNKRHPHCPMCRSIISTMNIKSITLFDEFSNKYNI